MPTYDYQCNACSHVFEKLVKIAQSHDPQECPSCGVANSNKLPGAPLLGDANRMFAQKKVPEGFKEVLRRIHEKSPGSRMKETSAIDFSSKQ